MPASRATPVKIGWLAAFSPRFLAAPSVLVLIAANLLPLAGVLFWGWDLFGLMVLYWLETGIIGFFAIIRMAIAARFLAIMYVPFFIVHFGGFMAGHFFLLKAMFGGGGSTQLEELPDLVWTTMSTHGLWLAFGALCVSHTFSFVRNFVLPSWRNWRSPPVLPRWTIAPESDPAREAQREMLAPYGRVILMHLTIIFGAVLVAVFKAKVAAFVLLIALKIAVDVAAHVRQNARALVEER